MIQKIQEDRDALQTQLEEEKERLLRLKREKEKLASERAGRDVKLGELEREIAAYVASGGRLERSGTRK